MKIKRRLFIQLLLMVGFVFIVITACNKTNDLGYSENTATIEDASGNIYKTIKIGSQVWMAENLKTTKYNDGTSIPNVTDAVAWGKLSTGAYCNYDNLENNVATYGLLYNWYAVNTGKLAPTGWHVPTDDDWIILENYLIANGYNYDGTKAENKVAKSLCSKNGWTLSSNAGTPGEAPGNNNSSGFTAFPGAGVSVVERLATLGRLAFGGVLPNSIFSLMSIAPFAGSCITMTTFCTKPTTARSVGFLFA